jgi:hypothetical protein
MQDYYTENLADFGFREIRMLRDTLTAWLENGLPEGFWHEGVKPAMNRNSGYVFLTNDDYQVAMLSEDSLQIFHSLPYGGAEGFLSDLIEENNPDDLHADDVEYILNAAETAGIELPLPWSEHQQ